MSEDEIKEVTWEGVYGCFDEVRGTILCVTGIGISYYPMCPYCGEPAYEDDFCVFCKKKYKPIDWSKRPPNEPDEESEQEEKAFAEWLDEHPEYRKKKTNEKNVKRTES